MNRLENIIKQEKPLKLDNNNNNSKEVFESIELPLENETNKIEKTEIIKMI